MKKLPASWLGCRHVSGAGGEAQARQSRRGISGAASEQWQKSSTFDYKIVVFPRLYCYGLSPGLPVFSAKMEQYGSKSRITPVTHIKNKNKVIDNLGGNLLYQVQ